MTNLSPDVQTVAVTRVDGGLTVIRIVETEYVLPSGPELNNPTKPDEQGRVVSKRYEITPEYVDEIIAKHAWTGPLAPVSWRFVPNDFVDENTDRSYRNAWKDLIGNNKPDHDMTKAKELHREKLRRSRQPKLDQLDLDYIRALELNDRQLQTTIIDQKQKLRDAPSNSRIDAAQTIDELKLLTIEELTK